MEHSLWPFSRALHTAINERRPDDLETQIDDDVDWVIYGPVDMFVLGEDSAASMMRYSLTALDSNKPITLRLAHFARFRAGRLLNIRVLLDTYDLVEQALGRPIHLP